MGAGPSFGRIWLKNKPHYREDERTTKTVFGGVVKSGIYYTITDCLFLDLFVDYLYQPVHFDKHVNIGGVKIGAGIGVKF